MSTDKGQTSMGSARQATGLDAFLPDGNTERPHGSTWPRSFGGTVTSPGIRVREIPNA